MWIIPSNHPLSSHFVPEYLASKEDWNELSESFAFSLTVKSKPSSVPTWLQGWNRVFWRQPLSGRMLKPSLHKSFEEKYMVSLEDIRAPHSVMPVIEKEKKTRDTFGRIYAATLIQSDLFGASSKTSLATSRWDMTRFKKSLTILVTQLSQEYSQRKKLAHLTRENDYSFSQFPTPRANKIGGYSSPGYGPTLEEVVNWPTATVSTGDYQNQKDGSRLPKLQGAVKMWPTATTMDTEQEPEGLLKRAARLKAKHNGKNGTSYSGNGCGMSLGTAVQQWSTRSSPNENRQTKQTPSQMLGKHGRNLASDVSRWCIQVCTISKGSSLKSLTRKDGRDRRKDRLDHQMYGLQDQEKINSSGNHQEQSARNIAYQILYEQCGVKAGRILRKCWEKKYSQKLTVTSGLTLNHAWTALLMGTTLEKIFFVPSATAWLNKQQNSHS